MRGRVFKKRRRNSLFQQPAVQCINNRQPLTDLRRVEVQFRSVCVFWALVFLFKCARGAKGCACGRARAHQLETAWIKLLNSYLCSLVWEAHQAEFMAFVLNLMRDALMHGFELSQLPYIWAIYLCVHAHAVRVNMLELHSWSFFFVQFNTLLTDLAFTTD